MVFVSSGFQNYINNVMVGEISCVSDVYFDGVIQKSVTWKSKHPDDTLHSVLKRYESSFKWFLMVVLSSIGFYHIFIGTIFEVYAPLPQ